VSEDGVLAGQGNAGGCSAILGTPTGAARYFSEVFSDGDLAAPALTLNGVTSKATNLPGGQL
jgi:hypothetical protein